MSASAVAGSPTTLGAAHAGPADRRSRWRSLLFVPGASTALFDKASKAGADGLIFDLEDAVPDAEKAAARSNLGAFARQAGKAGADLLVRVNNDPARLKLDVAALPVETRAVVLPKAESVDDLLALHGLLAGREVHLGLKPGSIGAVAMIESPAAIFQLAALGKAPRVVGLALGSEDFSLAMGVPPSEALLTLPAQLISLAAGARGIMAFAIPHSIAAFRDAEGWTAAALRAKAFGATGGFCIHPSQIAALNAAFSPTDAEITWAHDVLDAWAKAEKAGQGVASLDGTMVDAPVVQRAQAVLSRRRSREKAEHP
jgi:citrate lyase subunit beta/citryl-CoA lyase